MTTAEDKELEEEITLAGNALLSPPSSVPLLFHLLVKLENCLMRVNQSPSDSVRRTLDLAIKALATKEILNHLDEDVKVCVASCISEIMRITAPDVPYEEEQLKEIFPLIVAAFENISDDSSHLFCKRVTILETMATVRSWVLMVDLECYSLISQMFKHFLTNIREHHKDIVFSSMGAIMIMILDEIEEIPLEIVSLLLDCKRDRNQDILPIARRLGQRVIENCSSKLAPYMPKACLSSPWRRASTGITHCGKKHVRMNLQESPCCKEKNDREECGEDQAFEEKENRKGGEKGKEKDLEEKKHRELDGTFQREIVEDKRSRKRIKKNHKGGRKPKYPGKQAMDTQCSPRKMHMFLSNLNGKKRSIIENSIFSPFLDIPRGPIHRDLIAALVECYDEKVDALIIADQPLNFCVKEIEKCIGLNFEGKRVDMNFERGDIVPPIAWRYFEIVGGNARIKEESQGACKEMDIGEKESSLKISDSLLLLKLNQMSVDGRREAEDFLRLSIIYMFNVYFFPSKKGSYILWWPLKFLENLQDFGSYAWGRAVYDYLWMLLKKAAMQLAGRRTFHAQLDGCIPLLEALACERISKLRVQMHLNERYSRSFKTIQKMLAKLQPYEIKKCKYCEMLPEQQLKGAEKKTKGSRALK